MEAVICLPVLLLVSLGVAQFAHIWLCRTMVHYAACCGARATLTAAPGTEKKLATLAAQRVCAPLAFFNPGGGADFTLPGINGDAAIAGSGAVTDDHILSVGVTVNGNQFHTRTEVTMAVPLLFPVAGPVIGRTMKLYRDGDFAPGADSPDGRVTMAMANDRFARIILHETVYMAKPYCCTWSGN